MVAQEQLPRMCCIFHQTVEGEQFTGECNLLQDVNNAGIGREVLPSFRKRRKIVGIRLPRTLGFAHGSHASGR